MNMKTGGAAFPDPGRAQSAKQREELVEKGLTCRDYFAAHAPIDLAEARNHWHKLNGNGSRQPAFVDLADVLALLRGQYADAMIAERSK